MPIDRNDSDSDEEQGGQGQWSGAVYLGANAQAASREYGDDSGSDDDVFMDEEERARKEHKRKRKEERKEAAQVGRNQGGMMKSMTGGPGTRAFKACIESLQRIITEPIVRLCSILGGVWIYRHLGKFFDFYRLPQPRAKVLKNKMQIFVIVFALIASAILPAAEAGPRWAIFKNVLLDRDWYRSEIFLDASFPPSEDDDGVVRPVISEISVGPETYCETQETLTGKETRCTPLLSKQGPW
jgi:hypothetical protein